MGITGKGDIINQPWIERVLLKDNQVIYTLCLDYICHGRHTIFDSTVFPYRFFRLRSKACLFIFYIFYAATMRFLCHVSTTDKQNAVERPHWDRTDIVRSFFDIHSPTQKSYSTFAASVRHCMRTMQQPCHPHAGAVQPSYDFCSEMTI